MWQDASRSSLRRRDELYFTRTNMLKEQLRLKQELEGTLPPKEPGSPRLNRSTGKPQSPRGGGGGGGGRGGRGGGRGGGGGGGDSPRGGGRGEGGGGEMPPRSPRSPDHVQDFEQQIIAEWRAAEAAAAAVRTGPAAAAAAGAAGRGGVPRGSGAAARPASATASAGASAPRRGVSFEFAVQADDELDGVGAASALWASALDGAGYPVYS